MNSSEQLSDFSLDTKKAESWFPTRYCFARQKEGHKNLDYW
jgi:hypothetical protein